MQTLRSGLYARVSTAEQQTLPLQMTVMEDYAGRRGWTIVAQVQDIGSGVTKRPNREELIKLANRRELDVIIVWRLDRWGRSLSDLTESLEDLRAIGLDFVSPGRAMAGMLAIFAQFERDVLRERVCAGLAHAKAKGKTLGRAATARVKSDKIRTLFSQELNKNQIVRRLHIGRGSVFRVLNANGHESQ